MESAQLIKSHSPFDVNSAGNPVGDRSLTSQSISSSALQQPDYNNINAIDERMRQLEQEARQMEDKYAYIK